MPDQPLLLPPPHAPSAFCCLCAPPDPHPDPPPPVADLALAPPPPSPPLPPPCRARLRQPPLRPPARCPAHRELQTGSVPPFLPADQAAAPSLVRREALGALEACW